MKLKGTPLIETVRLWFSLDKNLVKDEQIQELINNASVEISMDIGSFILNKLPEIECEYLFKIKLCTLLEENSIGNQLPGSKKDLSSKSVDGVSWSYITNSMGLSSKETCLQKYLRLVETLRASHKRPGILK